MMEQTTSRINPNSPQSQGVNLSRHTQKRSQQRSISENLMFLAMDYGKAIFKQGLIFYAVLDKLLPDAMDILKKQLKIDYQNVMMSGVVTVNIVPVQG